MAEPVATPAKATDRADIRASRVDGGPPLPVCTLRLATAWLVIAAAPLVAGAAAGLSRDAATLADAARWVLGLSVGLAPLLWAALAPDGGARDARARALDALLLAAGATPALALALPFTGLPADVVARALAHAACTLLGALLLVLGVASRRARVALAALWTGGLGALGLAWRDLLAERSRAIELLAPPLAQARLMDDGEGLALAALSAVGLPALAIAAWVGGTRLARRLRVLG